MTEAKAPTVRQVYKTTTCAKGFIGYYTQASKSWYGATTTLFVGLHGADGTVYPLLADGDAAAFTAQSGTKVLFKQGEYLVKMCTTGGGTKTPKLRLSSAALTTGAALTEVVLDQEIYTAPVAVPACFIAPDTQAITKLGYDMLLGKTADMATASPPTGTAGNMLYLVIGGGVLLLLVVLLILYIRHRRHSDNSDNSD
jgi:LPXTG-motif cell wall-anchored protein